MNEVANKGNNEMMIPQGLSFGFENVTTKDIKIPLIYSAQAMSKVCMDGIARPGDIVENMENRVLGGRDKPAQLVPFYFQKAYQVQKDVNGKKEFHAIQPWTSAREFETFEDGVKYYNYECFNFFVLVYGDKTFTKYMLSFRGSRNISSAGRPMLTQIMNQFQRGVPPFNTVYDIGVKQVENEKGKWFVFTANPNRGIEVDKETFEAGAREAKAIQDMFAQGVSVNTGESGSEVEDV